MSTVQVRCSRQVHRELKEISERDGVSLAHALELLVERAKAPQVQADPWEAMFQQDPAPQPQPQPDIEATMEGIVKRIDDGIEGLWDRIKCWLEENLTREDLHHHGGDENCQDCFDVANTALEEMRHQGQQEILMVPGMRDAYQFYLWAKARNEEAPNIPVVQSWADCPGVSEAIGRYGLSQGLVTINGGEDRVNDAQLTSNLLDNAMRLALRSRDLERNHR